MNSQFSITKAVAAGIVETVIMTMASMVGHLIYGAVLSVIDKTEPKLSVANI